MTESVSAPQSENVRALVYRLRNRNTFGPDDFPMLREAADALDALAGELETAYGLLRRVEPELVPHHDAAQELADKFGLGQVANSTLVEDIRAALSVVRQEEPPPEEQT